MAKKRKKKIFFRKNLGGNRFTISMTDDFLDTKGSRKLVGKPIKKDKKKVNQL